MARCRLPEAVSLMLVGFRRLQGSYCEDQPLKEEEEALVRKGHQVAGVVAEKHKHPAVVAQTVVQEQPVGVLVDNNQEQVQTQAAEEQLDMIRYMPTREALEVQGELHQEAAPDIHTEQPAEAGQGAGVLVVLPRGPTNPQKQEPEQQELEHRHYNRKLGVLEVDPHHIRSRNRRSIPYLTGAFEIP
jgi:hypothetical protein